MSDYGRRMIVDLEFEVVVGEATRAIRDEGLEVISRIDVRDHFKRELRHDFRRYVLLEAWSPELAIEAFRHDLDVGTVLPTRFAIYELADGETAFVANEPLSPVSSDLEWRRDAPALASIADRESDRIASVFTRLRHRASHPASDEGRSARLVT